MIPMERLQTFFSRERSELYMLLVLQVPVLIKGVVIISADGFEFLFYHECLSVS